MTIARRILHFVAQSGAAESGSWLRNLLRLGRTAEAPADVFKGDAPSDEVFAVREASHYLKLDWAQADPVHS